MFTVLHLLDQAKDIERQLGAVEAECQTCEVCLMNCDRVKNLRDERQLVVADLAALGIEPVPIYADRALPANPVRDHERMTS
jgi:hypothetical protein